MVLGGCRSFLLLVTTGREMVVSCVMFTILSDDQKPV